MLCTLAEKADKTISHKNGKAYAEYDDFNDADRQLKHWLEVESMHDRIHSALDYQTPAQFEVACRHPFQERLEICPGF